MATHTDKKYGIMYKKKGNETIQYFVYIKRLRSIFQSQRDTKNSFTFLMMRLVILKELI